MSLFIATGSNQGEKIYFLNAAKTILSQKFSFVAESRIYHSRAVDYTEQADFYNQVLEFITPNKSPDEIMQILLDVELTLGRLRNIPKGPRTIDLDILFIDDLKIQTDLVSLPHPRAFERSFVILPLSELPGFKMLQNHFQFSFVFNNSATPLSN